MAPICRWKRRSKETGFRRCKQSCLENQRFGPEPFFFFAKCVKCVSAVFPFTVQSLGEQHHNNDGTLFHLHLSFLLSNPSCLITRAPITLSSLLLNSKKQISNTARSLARSLASNPQSLIGCDGNPGSALQKRKPYVKWSREEQWSMKRF